MFRVLLVEADEEAAAKCYAGLRAQLRERLALIHVRSLAEAVRTLMEVPFDVAVLELNVVDASGIATLAGVRSAAAALPIVVHAQALDDAMIVRALRAGAHECIAKNDGSIAQLPRAVMFAIERQRRLATIEAERSAAAHRATHDPLTGLANRELFLQQLERALAFGSRYGRKTGLLFVDLDHFKEINDTVGHAGGDTLLCVVSRRLLESVRRSDAVARLGGDEFVVLLPDVTSRLDIARVRDAILERLRAPIDIGAGHVVTIVASVGGSMSPLDGDTAAVLMHAADVDMYRDKTSRRRERSGSGELRRSTTENALTARHDPSVIRHVGFSAHRGEERLRLAVDRGELQVVYQPIVNTLSGSMIAAQASPRWNDPERGVLPPEAFLPLADDTGLIVPIGRFVLRDACAAVVRWRTNGVAPLSRVAVSISAVQLKDHALEATVASVLEQTGCPPDALILQVSEPHTSADADVLVDTLNGLKALGVCLYVQEFGVGHASLAFLRRAPVDGIKIDREFIRHLPDDDRDLALVSSVARLAHGLSLDVIAEGVETAAQSRELSRLHCVSQQGDYFCEAGTLETIESILSGDHGPGPRHSTDGLRQQRVVGG